MAGGVFRPVWRGYYRSRPFLSPTPWVGTRPAVVHLLTLSGTLTPTGALIKDVTITRAGTVTPAGALSKQTDKLLVGSLGLSGTLDVTKLAFRTVTGSLGLSGAVTKTISKGVSGALGVSGTLARYTTRILTGILTPVGALAKVVSKLLVGSLGLSGTASHSVSSGTIERTFTGTLTPTGALVKTISKGIGGNLAPSGSLVRTVLQRVVGVLTPAGVVTRTVVIARTFTGSLGLSGVLRRLTGKRATGQIGLSGTLSSTGGSPETYATADRNAIHRPVALRTVRWIGQLEVYRRPGPLRVTRHPAYPTGGMPSISPDLEPKADVESKRYGVDMATRLPLGVTIASAIWTLVGPVTTPPLSVTGGAVSSDGIKTSAMTSGGLAGTDYTVQVTMTLSDAQVLVELLTIRVVSVAALTN